MTKRKLIIAGVILILLIVGIARWRSTQTKVAATITTVADVPLKFATLNKDFQFSMTGANGVEITKLNYTITSAELRDTIILRGERATAAPGRLVFILNLKLRNDSNQRLQLNSQDYIRLSVNGENEWLAPEIHNDPVEIQAISTKLTRLGFAINSSDKDFRLRVGEIKGEKTTSTINF